MIPFCYYYYSTAVVLSGEPKPPFMQAVITFADGSLLKFTNSALCSVEIPQTQRKILTFKDDKALLFANNSILQLE